MSVSWQEEESATTNEVTWVITYLLVANTFNSYNHIGQQNSTSIAYYLIMQEEVVKQSSKFRELASVAERLGCTTSQLAIAWSLKNEHVHSVLIGAVSVEQLHEHLQALQVVGNCYIIIKFTTVINPVICLPINWTTANLVSNQLSFLR